MNYHIDTTNNKVDSNNALKWSSFFVLSASIILSITGSAKIISLFGKSHILMYYDPILNVRYVYLMPIIGIIELTVALIGFQVQRKTELKLWLLTWISVSFLIYKFGLWWINYQGPCHCLGNFMDVLGVSNRIASHITTAVAIYLLTGSMTTLVVTGKNSRNLVDNL